MSIGAFIIARMGSERLPGKTMLKILRKSMDNWIRKNTCICSWEMNSKANVEMCHYWMREYWGWVRQENS